MSDRWIDLPKIIATDAPGVYLVYDECSGIHYALSEHQSSITTLDCQTFVIRDGAWVEDVPGQSVPTPRIASPTLPDIEELEAIVAVLFQNAHRVDAADELTSEQLALCVDLVGGDTDHE